MTIYRSKRSKINYRKIYEQHHGKIPIDDEGRTYEVHHVDGNDKNNDPKNLIALSIHEHYEIHYWQEDWDACFAISKRLKISPEDKSELSRKIQRQRIDNGTHNLMKRSDGSSIASDLVKNGTHHLLGNKIQRVSGKNHYSYDHILYCFEHKITKERVIMTRNDFIKKYNLAKQNVAQMINNGPSKSVKGWILIKTEQRIES